jgi:PAS domain S-box-containing protein
MSAKKSVSARFRSDAAKGNNKKKAGNSAGRKKRPLRVGRTPADKGHSGDSAVADQALRESEQKYRALVEQSLQGLVIVQDARIVFANPALAEISGYTAEEIAALSPEEVRGLVHPEDQDFVWGRLQDRLAGKSVPPRYEYRGIRKDGSVFWLEMFASRVEYEGRPAIQGAVVEVTDRKRAEENQAKLIRELKAINQKVKNINQELTDFAYIVSHDLKAPLRGIKTLADWISTDYADSLDENGKERLKLLLGRVERMHNLIAGVLQYSRVGRVKEKKVRVDLNELVAEVIDMVAPPENIEVEVDDSLPVMECEKTGMIQVFENLLSNAIKYMDKAEGQIRVGCVEEDGFWKFSVSDNGPGIEAKYFDKIFRIFQTLAPRDEFESTGVGLTVVKKIVSLNGGKTWVESEPGRGSTFLFTLPRLTREVKNAELKADIAC